MEYSREKSRSRNNLQSVHPLSLRNEKAPSSNTVGNLNRSLMSLHFNPDPEPEPQLDTDADKKGKKSKRTGRTSHLRIQPLDSPVVKH